MLQRGMIRDLFGAPQKQAEVKGPAPQQLFRRDGPMVGSGAGKHPVFIEGGATETCICSTVDVLGSMRVRMRRH